jgi:hypothetical protein
VSAKIREMYRQAGISAPNPGKGEHTEKAHAMVIELRKKGMSKDNAWATAMSTLGRNKAVKKSHWDPSYHGENK